MLFPIGKVLVAETLPDSDPQKKVLLQYIKDYQAFTKNAPISTFGGHAWDGITIAVMCLEKVGTDAEKLRGCFETVKAFPGISGIFTMSPTDHTGIEKESLVMVKIVGGKFTFVDPSKYKDN